MVTGRVFKVFRPKGPLEHVGLLIEGWGVFHNTPERGEHVSDLNAFGAGQPIRYVQLNTIDAYEAIQRINAVLASPKPYSLVNNCEHSVSKILQAEAESPQLQKALFGLGLAILVIAAAKA